MLSSIWNFLKDNQAVLSGIGGGIAALAAGIWASSSLWRRTAIKTVETWCHR
jgi:hypothetical protein